MTNKVIKMIAIILVTITVVALLSQTSLATGISAKDVKISNFDSASDSSGAAESVQRVIGAIITIVQIVGIGVAIIMLIVLAIKYISAAPGDKADIKKHAVVYVVGAVVLFAASGILQIVKNFSGNISGTEQ